MRHDKNITMNFIQKTGTSNLAKIVL